MKNGISVLAGLTTGLLSVVWLLGQPTDTGFFGDFVRPVVLTLADLIFHSPEAAFAVAYPVVALYGVLFGVAAGLVCRLVLSIVLKPKTDEPNYHRRQRTP